MTRAREVGFRARRNQRRRPDSGGAIMRRPPVAVKRAVALGARLGCPLRTREVATANRLSLPRPVVRLAPRAV
jgi:hypothetical protein